MTFDALFDSLDLNGDDELSRSELHIAARQLAWNWREAPILAVFDLLTIPKPMPRKTFISYMNQITEDPLGPYGKVLLNAPHFCLPITQKDDLPSNHKGGGINKVPQKQHEVLSRDVLYGKGISVPGYEAGVSDSHDYQRLLNTLDIAQISIDSAALLIIDPQRSFTNGVWKQSIGPQADLDVKPIQLAFNNCARFLKGNYPYIETMFSRCPFPPDSYGWDNGLAEMINPAQLYFIKPGNSILFPSTNGFREWIGRCINNGKRMLVVGGCTLNSCVRVSSIETQNLFRDQKFQVVVDLSLSGARARNFMSSALYGGLSAVASAVHEMIEEGVQVVRHAEWVKRNQWTITGS